MATALGFVRELRAVEGVEAVVRRLSERGVPIAVASQSPPARVALSLRLCGLHACFGDHVYCASMVPRPKPAPDLFLLAARCLGVGPQHCLVIEDSPIGVQAAVAAGMTCLGHAGSGPAETLARAGARRVFRRMPELLDLLRSEGVQA